MPDRPAVPAPSADSAYARRRRHLGKRREAMIREGLAGVWIAFPQSYALQLLRELDLTRQERDEALARREARDVSSDYALVLAFDNQSQDFALREGLRESIRCECGAMVTHQHLASLLWQCDSCGRTIRDEDARREARDE